jgi:hypothetical protein
MTMATNRMKRISGISTPEDPRADHPQRVAPM